MKKGQIWVETVIYTLIGLALIGLVLAIATPKISQAKDKILVEQTIDSLTKLDNKIMEAWDWGPGNTRAIDFTMRRGDLFINSSGNNIYFVLSDLSKPYSEPGSVIEQGRIKIYSEETKKGARVYLILDYSNLADIRYNNKEELKKFSSTTTPYSFFVKNRLDASGSLFVLDLTESSS